MIRDAASQRQVDAADPRNSTWLSANAGSGKTRVLTDRVARLLLSGVSPQNILCLTYTKAAAAEMQNRLFKRLGEWAMMANDDLRADLQKLGAEHAIDDIRLGTARTLFARAIETPGGLKIQTIHSFCAAVLRRFPLEAKVSPQFREMEDREAQLLRAEVLDQIVQGNAAQVVHGVLTHFTGDDLGKLTTEVAGKREKFENRPSDSEIKMSLGLGPNARRSDALRLAFQGDEMDIASDITEVFSGQSKTYQTFAARLMAINYKDPSWAELETLFDLFLYKGTSNSKSVNFPQSNHGKAVEAMAPIADAVHDWMDRVAKARGHLWAMDAVDRTRAIYDFAAVFIPAYEARKLAMGMLDFDDLISKAKALLTDENVAQWVLFRLDGGIDHVLVDEAQDTSPNQWAVIERLTQEFAAGEGAQPERERTVFVVGDKKQSIYSFQGADPAAFDQMQHHFDTTLTQAKKGLNVLSLDHSFRSSQAILSVVDNTFVRDRADGMDDHLSHIAFKENMPGRVDLWPVIEKSTATDDRQWYDPVDQVSETDHTVQMANRVVAQIKQMMSAETIPVEVGNTGTYQRRPITEGDILILVQRRSELFSEIIRACKAADLNIAGADRLRVGAELAVKDLAALLNFLALPEDDLSLAATLRSPLFAWTEQDLFTLAHHRPKKGFLWQALRDSDEHPQTMDILTDLRRQADFLRPYDLIERILTRHDGRRKLLGRLGAEAEDGIDALLSQALAYESTGVPSLTGFLTWMETDDLEVKRQMDSQGDRIRVMTVHGAKGLEAPIVILPDTAKRDIRVNAELLHAGDQLIWKTPTKESAPTVSALRDEVIALQTRERLRLLYVAMTRAEKWLIVGAAGDVGDGADSWYNIVADGMRQRGDADVTTGDMTIKRVSHLDWNAPEQIALPTRETRSAVAPVFGETPTVTVPKTISPSELPGPKVMQGDPAGLDVDEAMARGTQIHLLLEHLPLAMPDDRWGLGLQLVNDKEVVGDVIRLLDEPTLAHLWDGATLTEVDITADIDGLGRIHGAIDRLVITSSKVIAIDYKSNRLVPDDPARTPAGLLQQMAAYRSALMQVYDDRPIEVAILWTQTASLMTLPDDLLHDALNSVRTA